jgi:glutamine synthetase
LGFKANGASELEYYMYRNSYEEAHKRNYEESALEPFGYFSGDYNLLQSAREEPFTAKMRKYLKGSGVPVENSKARH